MSRYDKYEPKAGGFRAPLAADWAPGDLSTLFGVGLDATGKVVKGAGTTGVVGVIVLTMVRLAGDIVDVMTSGEIVEAGLVAGTAYYATSAGAIGTVNTGTHVGHTVEGSRLIVRVKPLA